MSDIIYEITHAGIIQQDFSDVGQILCICSRMDGSRANKICTIDALASMLKAAADRTILPNESFLFPNFDPETRSQHARMSANLEQMIQHAVVSGFLRVQ